MGVASVRRVVLVASSASLTLLALVGASAAQIGNVFYERYTANLYIFGDVGDAEVSPACGLRSTYNDGSTFSLYKDLISGEVFIVVVNMGWDVRDVAAGDQYRATFNFYTGAGALYDNFTGYLTFSSKNSIIIPGIGGSDAFLGAIYGAASLTIVMPGNVSNAQIHLRGSAEGMNFLSECIDTAERMVRQQPVAPPPQVPRNLLTL